MARCAAIVSICASCVSVRMRIGLAAIHARFTPSTSAMITVASVRSMTSISSSSAYLTVCMALPLRQRRELLGLVLRRERGGDLRQVAIHDRVDLVQREVDAVVGYAALREVVG